MNLVLVNHKNLLKSYIKDLIEEFSLSPKSKNIAKARVKAKLYNFISFSIVSNGDNFMITTNRKTKKYIFIYKPSSDTVEILRESSLC